MVDYFHNPNETKTAPLDQILEHILVISVGQCDITDEKILSVKDEKFQLILGGLKLLHDDLEAYKLDFKRKIEAEYQVELLKKKNEELLSFNYVASHDLQEPLRTITSFSSILSENYSDRLDDNGQLYLRFINDSSKRMSELIFDLLNYSKIGSSYEFENLNPNEIIEEVLLDMAHVITSVNPKIDISDLPITYANRRALHQVFQNLIGNALKFRQEGQTVQITISCKKKDGKNIFCIEDNGIGIEDKYQDRVFGIFQRLHTRDKYEGTGIGLSLCKKIIESHHGDLWLESKIGFGSRFYFSIPKLSHEA